MKVTAPILHAFAKGVEGGNPAGVVLNGGIYSQQQRLRIAEAIGLSETAFVSSSTIADFKLDFYTPTRQIAHCGHATIAAFSYLSQLGLIDNPRTSKETVDGRREIFMDGDMAYMEQLRPQYTIVNNKDAQKVSQSLGLPAKTIHSWLHRPTLVNTGNTFLLAGLKTMEELRSLRPDFNLIHKLSSHYDLIGYYIFSRQTSSTSSDAVARMFAPRYGISEEAATGMAAGPLACLLHDKIGATGVKFIIEQGTLMQPPSPSLLTVNLNLKKETISGLMVGGKAILKDKREVELSLD